MSIIEKLSTFKVRCSAIHMALANSKSTPILTDKQTEELKELEDKPSPTDKQKERIAELLVKKDNGTKIILSDSCISYLMEEYAWITEKMVPVTKELMDIPQMQKGIIVEAQSLQLLSLVDGEDYRPNDNAGERERIYNEYLSGEVDAYVGESIMTATKIPDVKSIWDYPTFLCKIHESLTKANDWQIKGYLDISGAKEGFIANCLLTTPEPIRERIKESLLRKMPQAATDLNPEFMENWKIIERSMIFDKIPVHKRVFKKNVEPMNGFERNMIYDKVKVCREWLVNFHETYQNLNL